MLQLPLHEPPNLYAPEFNVYEPQIPCSIRNMMNKGHYVPQGLPPI
jgi:hypothetical protein